MTLSINTGTTADGGIVLTLDGEVDYATAPQIREKISSLLRTENLTSIKVDVAKVTVLDSTGIGTLVVAYRIARDMGIPVAVTNPTKFIKRLFAVVGAQELLEEPTDAFVATGGGNR
ncbi:MAG TPA: STAS domain-containing protein [Stackebrandtia sp.]|uniref:STAS domain-containing protein n=1 Tax=Stackebrandtia sp. TaxID=2023065 RepID=UPI002D51404B|nr:STAS domain-containing protein [Stackebrandtia sp.]HZE40749.1 STAS domain-containing protein [Stackebrandtia sp.]